MLRQRKGHLSSFRPAAGDLIQYLFLNLLRDIATGLYMKFMLTEHADETIGEKIVSSSTKKRKVSDKQLQALKNLAGFLSDEGGEGGSGSQGASTKNDGDGEVSTASEAADINKRNNAKKPAAKNRKSQTFHSINCCSYSCGCKKNQCSWEGRPQETSRRVKKENSAS